MKAQLWVSSRGTIQVSGALRPLALLLVRRHYGRSRIPFLTFAVRSTLGEGLSFYVPRAHPPQLVHQRSQRAP